MRIPSTMPVPTLFAGLRAVFLWTLVALLAATSAASAAGARRALLVGVSNYPKETVGDLQLAGPKNDVALMIDTVARMGFADRDTIVLADALEETGSPRRADGPPTRAAILAALADLGARSGPGDFVLLYFSGHGSQQPDPDPAKRPVPKPDGLEEIFLPIDIGPWEDSVGAVANALVDHELGRAVATIRATGAEVWVVIDACHSGTMTRAAGEGQIKQVAPEVLKIPEAALEKARAAARGLAPATRGGTAAGPAAHGWFDGPVASAATTRSGAALAKAAAPGGYVAFFAAYPDQLALQKNLPRGYGTEERRPHGVLTFYLAQALRSGRVATFRDLAHRVMAGYDQFGQAPTPMFEGDLGAPVPGGASDGVMRWPVTVEGDRLSVGAGVVDGLGVGAVVALATLEAPDTVRVFARIEAAGAAKAVAKPIEREGLAFDAALAGESLTARLVEKGADFVYRVARPPRRPATEEERAVAAALDAIAATPSGAVTIVDPAEAAELRLFVEEGRVWLVADDAEFLKSGRRQSPSVALPAGADAKTVRALVERPLIAMAKARNLVRVAGLIGPGTLPAEVAIEASVVRDGGTAGAGAVAADDRDCPALDPSRPPTGAVAFEPTASPRLGHCDTVWFHLTNRGTRPVDVTPLYVDGAGGVAYMGPPEGLRLDPGGVTRSFPLRIVTWSRKRKMPLPIGREHLLMVMVEVEGREALPADFRHLAQATPTGIANRGAGASPLGGLLEAASFGGATRGAPPAAAIGTAGIVDFGWMVVAPEEAAR